MWLWLLVFCHCIDQKLPELLFGLYNPHFPVVDPESAVFSLGECILFVSDKPDKSVPFLFSNCLYCYPKTITVNDSRSHFRICSLLFFLGLHQMVLLEPLFHKLVLYSSYQDEFILIRVFELNLLPRGSSSGHFLQLEKGWSNYYLEQRGLREVW